MIVVSETNTSAVITWGEPLNKNGVLLQYNVTVTLQGPLHHIFEDCRDEVWTVKTYTVDAAETSFVFEDGEPHYGYTVAIAASTSADFGPSSEEVPFQTLESGAWHEMFRFYLAVLHERVVVSVSDSPGEVAYNFTNVLGDIYDVTVSLNWNSPCNPRGNLSHFHVVVNGILLQSSVEDQKTYTVPVELDEDRSYRFEFGGIFPLYEYTVTIVPYVSSGIRGESSTLTFSSPDGGESSPQTSESR